MGFDVQKVRTDFPALTGMVHERPLVYLDNAATAQMPRQVMEAIAEVEFRRGNVHRGIHMLSEHCTAAYENARTVAAEFFGAETEQIVFTSGTTDGINRVAYAAEQNDPCGVAVTVMEHHSNFVPWQQMCRRSRTAFRVIPLDDKGKLDLNVADQVLDHSIGILAVTQCSNVLGTVNPIRELCCMAHERGIRVLVDGAQSICHEEIDVKKLDCDWFVCSGHKLGAPFGIGLLYCKDPMPPTLFGGGMVETVTETHTAFVRPPLCWEAGTPNVSGAIGFAAAVRYRQALAIGWKEHEQTLMQRAEDLLAALPGVRILGTGPRMGCLSFCFDGIHPFDAAALLDQLGIAVRSGHHCAQPLLTSLGLNHALRISPAFYNTEDEITVLAQEVERVCSILRGK